MIHDTSYSFKKMSTQLMTLVESKLWAKVMLGMILGIIIGTLFSSTGPFPELVKDHSNFIEVLMNWLAFPAKFFLKLVQMVIIPLIFASIIRGLAATTDLTQMKKLGGKFALFVIFNSTFAALIGIFVCSLIEPGAGLSLKGAVSTFNTSDQAPLINLNPEIFLNFLPVNPLFALVQGQMLDVVILSIIGGMALVSLKKEQIKIAMDGLEILQEVCMTIITWAMKLAPYAVFGMLFQVTSSTGMKALFSMGRYIIASFTGFGLVILFYLLLIMIFKRISPLTFLKKMGTPLLLAFSTSSSAAAMPVTMKTAEEELNIDEISSRFLIPLGATVNMAGTAIWQTSAVIFIGQAYDMHLNFAQLSIVVGTSIASSIGSPGVPGVGIGILSAVLLKIGIPVEGISLILGVDRLIDMGCTVVNVAGDLTAVKLFGMQKTHFVK
ncbi:MAG: dicarboxylate/amino acid:cation symporter [Bdellovibrio sp. CG11_big_fil_rev_8_21_14_0_20_39_38]|nr:MAG: dicarboxylate/amino acid:cation symporter [Bdellovibrio sp. CG22_combo_CG10-13_8_21_14_all_39_27]PIR33458.1 MAG: dicarboxylate/amino acid:cation symporter [Bdellovibrio sp. CG11_big_fil_rev_8_21_14_0_20_39_38]